MTRPFHALALMAALCSLASTPALADPTVPRGIVSPLASFSEVLERPLFAPDRKRHVRAAPAAAPEKVVLSAIIMLKDKRYAMLREGNAAPRRINEGDAVGTMTVKKILRDRIITTAADGTDSVMHLFAEASADTAKTSSAAAGAVAQALPPATPPIAAGIAASPTAGMVPADNRPLKPLISLNR